MNEPLNVISLGAGVQSSAVLLMSYEGDLPQADYAIFADTGWEPKAVYEHLDRLEDAVADRIPILRVSAGNIRDELMAVGTSGKPPSPPLFVEGSDGRASLLRRQCTKAYKLAPIYRAMRELTTLPDRKRGTAVRLWMGISLDEVERMKPNRERWVENVYPLIDHRLTRWDCQQWLATRGWSAAKSACIGCPFHSREMWRQMKDEAPEEFEDAVAVDRAIRHAPGIKAPAAFLHRDLVPLDMVDLSRPEDRGQLTFGFTNECEGMCAL